MCLHPTALLSGLLLVLLASDLRNTGAIADQAVRSRNQPTVNTRLADASVQTFHRGSGRRQLFRAVSLVKA